MVLCTMDSNCSHRGALLVGFCIIASCSGTDPNAARGAGTSWNGAHAYSLEQSRATPRSTQWRGMRSAGVGSFTVKM